MRRYRVTYDVKHEPFPGPTAHEVRAASRGACDALAVVSIIRGDDGSRSQVVASLDGVTGEALPDVEIFKTWGTLAHQLAESTALSDAWRAICETAFQQIRALVLSARGDT